MGIIALGLFLISGIGIVAYLLYEPIRSRLVIPILGIFMLACAAVFYVDVNKTNYVETQMVTDRLEMKNNSYKVTILFRNPVVVTIKKDTRSFTHSLVNSDITYIIGER